MATSYQYEAPVPEWPELAIARMTYPTLGQLDQGSWLGMERVSYYPGRLHGYFTFRVLANKYGPNIEGHIAGGKSHVLAPMVGKRMEGGKDKVLTLFLVDLRKAALRKNLAKSLFNRHNEEYLLFDALTPGVSLFAESLRVE